MPLGHRTLSHGVVAFGFFNIDSDCLLLQNLFFFATDFCEWVREWAQEGPPERCEVPAYAIDDRRRIGDLQAAIRGVPHPGFLWAVYERFPFPGDPHEFKQRPEGHLARDYVESILREHAAPRSVTVRFDRVGGRVDFGGYVFDREGFLELLRYVWRGGMPTWRAGVRPTCVVGMIDAARRSPHWPFAGTPPFST